MANLSEAWLYPVNAMRNRAVASVRTQVRNKVMAQGIHEEDP